MSKVVRLMARRTNYIMLRMLFTQDQAGNLKENIKFRERLVFWIRIN